MVMNTKQLWNALTLNTVINNNFDGIFSIDTLKEIKEKPTLIVRNKDPSDKAGEHWVLFFFHDNTVDFYDSLAHEITYYGSEFIYFIKRFANNLRYTVRRTQPIKTDLCGHYCLYYVFKKCEGYSMEDIIVNFHNVHYYNVVVDVRCSYAIKSNCTHFNFVFVVLLFSRI